VTVDVSQNSISISSDGKGDGKGGGKDKFELECSLSRRDLRFRIKYWMVANDSKATAPVRPSRTKPAFTR
jgi:hypothetical protein